VGVLRRVFILNMEDGIVEFVNPHTLAADGKQEGAEGCLSIPGRTGLVKRPNHIIVEAQDRYGKPFVVEYDDFWARALFHELDHLDGILYTAVMERFLTAEEIAKLEEEG
jgi:peptide deformylase